MNSSFVATIHFHMSCTGLSYKPHLEKDTFANNDYKSKQKKKRSSLFNDLLSCRSPLSPYWSLSRSLSRSRWSLPLLKEE